MPDRETLESEGHPVISGLLALVGVGLAVGMIAGATALVGVRMLGLGDGSASAETTSNQSMYLPRPEKTQPESGPLLTLDPELTESSTGGPDGQPSETETTEKPDEEISLSASQTEVAAMEQIDLTGVYPGGEGAILQVQKFTSGRWEDFPVTVSVSDETFTTYVQTSQTGVNRFRVVDTDSERVSNEVRVRVG